MDIVTDISFWEDTADFKQMAVRSRGSILRAGQGLFEDKRFQEFRADAKVAGFPFGNYWFYDNRVHPKRQAEKWAEVIGNDEGLLDSWLDIEHALAGDYKSYKCWWDCAAYFKQLKPNAVLGIYTRASYFNDPAFQVPSNHAFRNLPLWVAHYDPPSGSPDLPKGWADWLYWQFTDHADGHAYGVGSAEIDLNYFNGDFDTYYNQPVEVKQTLTASYGNKQVEYEKQ